MTNASANTRVERLEGRMSHIENEVQRMLREIKEALLEHAKVDSENFKDLRAALGEHYDSDSEQFAELGSKVHDLHVSTAVTKAEMTTTVKLWSGGIGIILAFIIPVATALIVNLFKG